MSPARAGTSAVVAVLGAAGLLLVLVTWAASIGPDRVVSGGDVERVQPQEQSSTAPTDPGTARTPDDVDRTGVETPGWVRTVAFFLEVITIGVVLFLLGRLLGRLHQLWVARVRRRREPIEDVEFEVLGTAAHVSDVIEEDAAEQRTLLVEVGEPRNAIVACWHRFEQQALRAGAVRRPWQTTAEFVLDVLDLVGADRGAVARLADLYREARFSDHPMTEQHRGAALDELDTIHHSLRMVAR
jgi:hypothetical protein